MLQQRHVNLIDDQNHIFLNDPKVASTVRVYAEMVGGPDAVGTDFNPAPGMNYRDVANGDVCAMITPDWMVGYMKLYSADAAGKCAMMPLPIYDPGDSRTASWGGTMIGIPRDCKRPEEAWKLIEAMYFDHDSVAYRRQTDAIIPPIRKYWTDEVYRQPDPYFMNSQNSNELFIQLADELPVRYVTPFTIVAQQLLSDVLNRTVKRIDTGKTENLDQDIQHWLDDSAADLERRMKFATFED
jgi:ABC-type glycerol-3-phosphate transport system substrate-binding protein